MSRTRRIGMAAIAALVALALAACAGLPVSGPVNAGGALGEDDASQPDFSFVPDGPSLDATPEQIVEGFILAGSGPRENWRIAKEFLSSEFAEQWKPEMGVTVYEPGSREALVESGEGQMALTLRSTATVDASGVYTAENDRELTLQFTLAQRSDGQWRITQAPDGIVLDSDRFESVFGRYSLMFFDPTWEYLVPDVRWFPVTNSATSIAVALIDGGPSRMLQGAVRTAFTDASRLAGRAVPERSGVAEVSLQPGALELDQRILDRMYTQLAASLETAGVLGVDMVVDGEALSVGTETVRPVRVDTRSMVMVGDVFGLLSGGAVEPIAGLSDMIAEAPPVAVEVDADRESAALLNAGGEVVRVTAAGQEWVLDGRAGLIEPTMDAQGRVWSVPAGDPASVIVYDTDGVPHLLESAWSGATSIQAMRVSRDGTRVAAIVREGATSAVWVAAVLRDEDGMPVELGERVTVAILEADGLALSWVGAADLAIVASDGAEAWVIEQPVGGPGERVRAPEGVVAVAGGNQTGAVRVLTADGQLFEKRGGTWISVATEIDVLATQRGMPR